MLKKNEQQRIRLLHIFVFYYGLIVTPVILSFVNCALILSIVSCSQPIILIVFKLVQPSNILVEKVTLLVFQPLKSKEVRLVQPLNI